MFEFTEEEFNTICKKAMLNEELTKILDNMLKVFDNKITKFLDEMDDAFVSFKEENFVFDWT